MQLFTKKIKENYLYFFLPLLFLLDASKFFNIFIISSIQLIIKIEKLKQGEKKNR